MSIVKLKYLASQAAPSTPACELWHEPGWTVAIDKVQARALSREQLTLITMTQAGDSELILKAALALLVDLAEEV